jgi:hypothetical protein
MKKTTALLLVTLLISAGAATPALAEGYGKQKVVYHINTDDPKKQAGALRNIKNHINAVGAENLNLKVVLHGKGLSLLVNAKQNLTIQSRVINLKEQNITFQVCANTLRGKKIDYESDLFDVDKADIVPSGVAELAHLQAQGYVYIKP